MHENSLQTCAYGFDTRVQELRKRNKDGMSHVSLFRNDSEQKQRIGAAGSTEFLMDGRFIAAPHNISRRLIIQQLTLPCPPPSFHFLFSKPLFSHLLSICSFHLLLSEPFFHPLSFPPTQICPGGVKIPKFLSVTCFQSSYSFPLSMAKTFFSYLFLKLCA